MSSDRRLCTRCHRWIERKAGFFAKRGIGPADPFFCSARCASEHATEERRWKEESERANLLQRIAGEDVES